MESAADELSAILTAYELVARTTWPDLHPALAGRAERRPGGTEAQLRAELAAYLREATPPRSNVRIFWKMGPGFTFGGCNDGFAKDAGLGSPAELIGLDDFDKRFPWRHQAAKYRRDDQNVVRSSKPNLDFVERQEAPDGSTVWVRVGKAPIKTATGAVIGLLGMYEALDPAVGRALFMKTMMSEKKPTS
jgi:PAS domain-containing protein